jgi:hypothetical protein
MLLVQRPIVVVKFLYHFLRAPHKILSQKHVINRRISGSCQTEFIKYMPTLLVVTAAPPKVPPFYVMQEVQHQPLLEPSLELTLKFVWWSNKCSWISDISWKWSPHWCNVLFIHISHYKMVGWTQRCMTVTTRRRINTKGYGRQLQQNVSVILWHRVAQSVLLAVFDPRGRFGKFLIPNHNMPHSKIKTSSSSSSVGPVANTTDVLQPSRLIVFTLSPPRV